MDDDDQLDLFSRLAEVATPKTPAEVGPALDPRDLTDEALVAMLHSAGMVETITLANEIGRRRLASAIPALEAVCRRFAGFGLEGPVIGEQAAALKALAEIGGARAAEAVTRAIVRSDVEGATLAVAVAAAVRLSARLPFDRLLTLLRHGDPAVRADACQLAYPHAEVTTLLIDLLDDLNPGVHLAAARALARMARAEALPALVGLLRTAPSVQIIDALGTVADEDAIVLLGRQARAHPDLIEAVLDALDGCDTPLANKVAAGVRWG